jgi:hypothetical protein
MFVGQLQEFVTLHQRNFYAPAREYLAQWRGIFGELDLSQNSIWAAMQSCALNGKDINMRSRWILVQCVAAITLSTSPSNAGPCTREIDREWVEVGAKIQARIGAGRSSSQGTVGLLHHQPTPSSVAAAQEMVGDIWAPLETAVIALARAREADHANDAGTCKEALTAAQRAFLR